MRLLFLFTLSVFILSATTAFARQELGASKEEADVNVGCLFPLSGYGVRFGNDSSVGIKLALEDIEKNIPNPPKIRVLIEDTKLKASKAIRHVRDYVKNDKTKFICGIVSSSIALEVTKIIEDLGVIFIGTDNASSRLTGSALSPNYYRLTNNTLQTMYAGAKYIRDNFQDILTKRPLRIAFIGPDYDYGYQSWIDFQNVMKELDIPYEAVATVWPNLFEVDFTPYIQSLKKSRPDLIVDEHWGDDFITFLRQGDDNNLFKHSRIANFGSGGDFDVLAEMKDKMPLGLILSARHHVNWPDTTENKDFVSRFYKEAGHYPSYVGEGAYSGIMAIAHAIVASKGSLEIKDLKSALDNVKLKLPEDPEGFMSYMNPKTHQIQQVISIGETVPDTRFSPAARMLGNWHYYLPETKQ